ncbi:UTRA domain-containing protein [Streptomyces sp. NPDC004726]
MGTEYEDKPLPAAPELYQALTEMGHELHFAEHVRPRMPLPDQAHALRLGEGVPLLHILRVTTTEDGKPLALEEFHLPGEDLEISYPLRGAGRRGPGTPGEPPGIQRSRDVGHHSGPNTKQASPDSNLLYMFKAPRKRGARDPTPRAGPAAPVSAPLRPRPSRPAQQAAGRWVVNSSVAEGGSTALGSRHGASLQDRGAHFGPCGQVHRPPESRTACGPPASRPMAAPAQSRSTDLSERSSPLSLFWIASCHALGRTILIPRLPVVRSHKYTVDHHQHRPASD